MAVFVMLVLCVCHTVLFLLVCRSISVMTDGSDYRELCNLVSGSPEPWFAGHGFDSWLPQRVLHCNTRVETASVVSVYCDLSS